VSEKFVLTTVNDAGGALDVVVAPWPGRLSPRAVFDPEASVPRVALLPAPSGPVAIGDVVRSRRLRSRARTATGAVVEFYRDPLSWLALLFTSWLLCYIGGLPMFWFHAVALDEGGPAISWYAHWLLDSTFAFVALTPALLVIMPLAVWLAAGLGGSVQPRRMPWLYAAVAGVLFALVTIPGPLAHNMLIGRGTWIANHVTQLVGDPGAPLAPATTFTPLALMTQQLGAAVALYVVLAVLSVPMMRGLVRVWRTLALRRRTAAPASA
jgi:hypothetical protein